MWDKFKLWLSGMGAFLFDFAGTSIAGFMKKYGPRAIEIVIEVALDNLSGPAKHHKATAMLLAEVPGMIEDYYAQATIKSAYEIWKKKQEAIDTDGDGIPDYRDLCKLVGDQGCGVDENGCPIPCPDPDQGEA